MNFYELVQRTLIDISSKLDFEKKRSSTVAKFLDSTIFGIRNILPSLVRLLV